MYENIKYSSLHGVGYWATDWFQPLTQQHFNYFLQHIPICILRLFLCYVALAFSVFWNTVSILNWIELNWYVCMLLWGLQTGRKHWMESTWSSRLRHHPVRDSGVTAWPQDISARRHLSPSSGAEEHNNKTDTELSITVNRRKRMPQIFLLKRKI